ncbi:hypothetical protein SAMN04488529_11574 [Clostridium gasigenes]|uniref:Uncharacterized protein n=1 Tax=Clostridium gasigenes TaxID=94869 RepID=A0A1H0VBY5_9CLOT|nr:hypothetical protein SAMN04488529_11574 [Clostridium gasigenes]
MFKFQGNFRTPKIVYLNKALDKPILYNVNSDFTLLAPQFLGYIIRILLFNSAEHTFY